MSARNYVLKKQNEEEEIMCKTRMNPDSSKQT